MKILRSSKNTRDAPLAELTQLRVQLAESDAMLRAIRSGEVDTVTVGGKQGDRVFTLDGAEHAYRTLIESMSEGALMLTADKDILYANQCFARMIKCPLEQVTGGSFRRFLSTADQARLRPLMKRSAHLGSKIQMLLKAGDGSQLPVQISVCELAGEGSRQVTIGMVVADMTQARHTEERMRALTHRVMQVQEAERGRVALELHDNITQILCAVALRFQALTESLSTTDGRARQEAEKLREMLSETVDEVERIARNLRPSILDQLGLVAVLHATSTEFAKRTGVAVKLTAAEFATRLPPDTEVALYRILQEALKNVEQHARARRVAVHVTTPGEVVQLTIKDDGIGFEPRLHPFAGRGKRGLGLLGMRERATYAGGTLTIKSVRHTGTEIEVRIPLTSLALSAEPHRGVGH